MEERIAITPTHPTPSPSTHPPSSYRQRLEHSPEARGRLLHGAGLPGRGTFRRSLPTSPLSSLLLLPLLLYDPSTHPPNPPTPSKHTHTQVTLEQQFTNTDTEAIEAVYRFPLDAQAVLKSFSVEINGKTIQGQVEEKQAAADTYDDALASGHGGFLLNQDAETKDIFSLRVGNLPPQASATIRLSYVAQIDEELWLSPDDGKPLGGSVLRLVIPTAVAPRYHPATDQLPELYEHAVAALAKWPTDLLKIEGKIKTASPITELRPHTYKDETTTTIKAEGEQKEASFRMQVGSLTEDFVLAIHLDARLADRAWVEPATGALTVSAGLKPGYVFFFFLKSFLLRVVLLSTHPPTHPPTPHTGNSSSPTRAWASSSLSLTAPGR